MREICLGFFNTIDFYQSLNFDCVWWILLDIKPTCCTHHTLPITFKNILGFLQKGNQVLFIICSKVMLFMF